jgi:hypothetical protein
MLGWLEWRWLGGIYRPLPPIQPLGQVAIDGRTGQSGAPLDTVRCASHVTQPLGFWRFRPLELCRLVAPDNPVPHQTGTLTSVELSAHCSCCRRPLEPTVALPSHCSAGAPDSLVNYSEVVVLKPEGGKFEVVRPWAPDSPVRQTRVLFGFFCSFLFEP